MRFRNIRGSAILIGLFILIMDSKTAAQGAAQGLTICLQTVVPSLFPFIFLSVLLNDSYVGRPLSILRPLGTVCNIPQGAESLLISSFLGGYPVGAQSVSEAYEKGSLSRYEAERMLSFCNNAGPAFLFGMIASFFSKFWMIVALWCIQIMSAVLVSKIMMRSNNAAVSLSKQSAFSVSDALRLSLRCIAVICGWVILFRVIIAFSDKWFLWICSAEIRTIILGILDLTNGSLALPEIADEGLRFVICSGVLSFGGLCITMQTRSVCPGLSLRYYYIGKAIQTVFSILLSLAAVHRNIWLFGVIFLLTAALKVKNKDSIPSPIVV